MNRCYQALAQSVHQHQTAWKHVHHGTHLAYFATVASHGPYHYAALALLVLGVVFAVFKVEA